MRKIIKNSQEGNLLNLQRSLFNLVKQSAQLNNLIHQNEQSNAKHLLDDSFYFQDFFSYGMSIKLTYFLISFLFNLMLQMPFVSLHLYRTNSFRYNALILWNFRSLDKKMKIQCSIMEKK